MKKYIALALVLSFITGGAYMYTANTAQANPPNYDRYFMSVGGGSSTLTNIATTSVTFLSSAATASTTFPFPTNGADSATLNFRYTGSTTAAALASQVEVTNDNLTCDTTPTVCNWYGVAVTYQQTPNATTSVVIASTTSTYTHRPDSTATSSLSLTLPSVSSKFMRVKFGTTGANAAIWMEVNLKKQEIY